MWIILHSNGIPEESVILARSKSRHYLLLRKRNELLFIHTVLGQTFEELFCKKTT